MRAILMLSGNEGQASVLGVHCISSDVNAQGYSLNLYATWYSQFDRDYSLSEVDACGCDAFTLD